jgi:hypothetical protein
MHRESKIVEQLEQLSGWIDLEQYCPEVAIEVL